MNRVEEAKELHLEIIATARRRQARLHEIEDPRDFDQLIEILEVIGDAVQTCAAHDYKPDLTGRGLLFYARCIATAAEGGLPKGPFKEAPKSE